MAQQEATGPVAGLGVDIVEIERMTRTLERTPSFASRVFTQGEQAYCNSKHKPAVHYATHFAAKEAVLKALGTGFADGIGIQDVEVAHNEKGRPLAILHGKAAQIAEELGVVEMHLSLSRTHGTAVANAIAITQQARPQKETRVDPREQLTAAFKELRGMLDEMGAVLGEGATAGSDSDAPAASSAHAEVQQGELDFAAEDGASATAGVVDDEQSRESFGGSSGSGQAAASAEAETSAETETSAEGEGVDVG